MRFSSFIVKNLLRRRFRALLTALGVAVAIAAVVSLLGLSSGLRRSTAERFSSRGVDLIVLRAGAAQRQNSSLNQAIGDRLTAFKEVRGVAPGLTDMVSFGDTSFIGVPLHGWPANSFAFNSLTFTEGKPFGPDDRGKIVLGRQLAQALQRKTGDTLDVEGSDFQVVGVYESDNMMDMGSAVVPLADLQELMDREGQVSEFQVALNSPAEEKQQAIDAICAEIEKLRDADGNLLRLDAMPTQDYINKSTEIKLINAMAWITSAIALVIGSVGMLNTMVMSVLERTQEIGILRAIGWRKQRVVLMVLAEACLLSLLGATLGVLLAILLTSSLASFSTVQMFVRGDLSPQIIVAGFAMAGIVALIGGAYPAIRGATLPPTEALRYE